MQVFSAFQDALAMLGKALAANGVQAVHLRGNREVFIFRRMTISRHFFP